METKVKLTKFKSWDKYSVAVYEKNCDLFPTPKSPMDCGVSCSVSKSGRSYYPRYCESIHPEELWMPDGTNEEEMLELKDIFNNEFVIVYDDGKKGIRVRIDVEEVFYCDTECTVFGKIKNNGETISLQLSLDRLDDDVDIWDFSVEEISTSCTLAEILKGEKKDFKRITEFKDAILERSRILFSENKEGDKGRYGIKNYPESGNFFFVQYHGKNPSKKWKVSANLKEEIQEPIQKVTYSGKHEIEVEVKDMLRYYDKYALFGEIKGNGEKIHLLVEYDKDDGFTVEDIYTSCKLEDVFKKSEE